MESTIEQVRVFLHELFPAECHGQVWLVGGTVRDALLQRPLKDIDLVAAVSAGKLEQLGFRPVEGKTTGSIWFRNFPSIGTVEITRIGAAEALPDDLLRRDFTVNAMLLPISGDPADPLGGLADLAKRQLRPCSAQTFSNDPLRIFRAFRFAAEGFSLQAETAALIRSQAWEERLQLIPVERFSREMLKAFAAPGPQRFFLNMLDFSVGRCWLPELFRMAQIPAGPLRYHPEGDLLAHSIEVLERLSAVSADPVARFCAFFHDIGKLSTDALHYPQHHGHEKAGSRVAEDFCRKLALPTDYGRALATVSRLHGNANKIAELRPATKIRMAEQAIRGGVVDILPLIASADKGANDFDVHGWLQIVAVARMNSSELGIDTGRLTVLQAVRRSEFILQRRVELLKSS
jgi:tRNA nucleotidyltransferase (CCA-adding enzyme)